MGTELLKYIFRFAILILTQALVLNELQVGGYLNPMLYVLFLLQIPLLTPKGFYLALAFGCGLTMDLFCSTGGIHAASCVLMAFLRPAVINRTSPRDNFEMSRELNVNTMGLNWFVRYAVGMLLLHQFTFYFIEAFRFSLFFSALFKAISGAAFTLLLILLTHYLFSKSKRQ